MAPEQGWGGEEGEGREGEGGDSGLEMADHFVMKSVMQIKQQIQESLIAWKNVFCKLSSPFLQRKMSL